MSLAAATTRCGETVADLHAFDRLNTHQCCCQARVKPPVPVNMTAEARREAMSDHFHDPAERVAVFAGRVDLFDHQSAGLRVGTANRVCINPIEVAAVGNDPIGSRDRADTDNMTQDGGTAGLLEQALCNGAECNPSRRLAGTGPLQHGTSVVKAVLLHPDEVRVPGPRPGEGCIAGEVGEQIWIDRVRRHHLFPLRPLRVSDANGHW